MIFSPTEEEGKNLRTRGSGGPYAGYAVRGRTGTNLTPPPGVRVAGSRTAKVLAPLDASDNFVVGTVAALEGYRARTGLAITLAVTIQAQGALGGRRQTVPRAELNAILIAAKLELANGHALGEVTVHTDHLPHVARFAQGRVAAINGGNGDLWAELFQVRGVESLRLQRTRAHRDH